MSILAGLFEKREHPGKDQDWRKHFGLSTPTPAGVHVDHHNSIQVSTVFACQRVLAESVAMLPLILYGRLARGKERAVRHSLYSLLHDLPNPEMTSMELRETATGHLALWGNAYLEIEYNGAGDVAGLWPLRPDKMRVKRTNGRLRYIYTMPDKAGMPDQELPAINVMHVKGLGFDGVMGYDPVYMARKTLGLTMATEEFGSRFFGNGAQTGTVYTHPGQLSPEAHNRLERSIEKRHQGLENAHRIMILEEGMKAEKIGIPPDNAQFLETRKFQVPEIARWFRMPLHKIQDLERSTFSNIEHQAIEFVTDTIMPWLTRWEQAVYRDLLTVSERRQYFAEHLVDALLRGDTKSRYEAYAIARNWGWYSANDIRERENENPVEGGDTYLVPLNMIPADQVGEMPESPPPDDVRGDVRNGEQRSVGTETRAANLARQRLRLAASYERLLREAAGRVIRREVNDVKRAIGKFLLNRSAAEFDAWLSEFYREHREFWVKQFLPILMTYADQVGAILVDELGGESQTAEEIRQFIEDYVVSLGNREAVSSEFQLQALMAEALDAGEDPVETLDKRLDHWEEKRPAQVAMHESRNALNAFALAFYGERGIRQIIWRAVGDSCPYCTDLDGTVIGIESYYLEAGQEFQPEGAERPLSRKFNVRHGPLHDGCDCMTMAA